MELDDMIMTMCADTLCDNSLVTRGNKTELSHMAVTFARASYHTA